MSVEEDILIEQFLRNLLSDEQRNDFLDKVSNDVDFREKFLLEKQLFETLNEEEWSYASNVDPGEVKEYATLYKNNAERLEKVIEKAKANHKRKNNLRRLVYFSAAAAALIAIFINFYPQKDFISPEEVYVHYASSYELPSLISRNSEDNTGLIAAEHSFKNKNYQEALNHIEALLEKDKDNSILYLYKAISHLELEEYDSSEKTLNALIDRDLIDSEKGYWHKSLLYLKANELDKCEQMLNIIIENSYFKYKDAKEMLKDLQDLKE